MDTSKSSNDTALVIPVGLVRDDERRRRHVRLSSSSLLLAAVMIFFCASCLGITLHYAVQFSQLKERMERLESNRRSEFHANDAIGLRTTYSNNGIDYKNVEQLEGDADLQMRHLFRHRKTREIKEKKRKPKSSQNSGKTKTSSAIHLSLNVREATKDELQLIENGEVVTLSYGELSKLGFRLKKELYNGEQAYIYKSWRVADWAQEGKDYHFDPNTGAVKIQRKGLYFIYSQILYHNSAARSSYVIMVDEEAFVKCLESVDAIMPTSQSSADSARYKTCYVGAARVLNKDQSVWIKDLYNRFITVDSTANFFGLIKIADLDK